MVTTTETQISANYRDAQESLYGADSAIERVLQIARQVDQCARTYSSFVMAARSTSRSKWARHCCDAGHSGFFGASSIERLPTERGIRGQVQEFKGLKPNKFYDGKVFCFIETSLVG
jgi:hypothetical protein